MAEIKFKIGQVAIGEGPFIIAGPCAVESKEVAFRAAEEIKKVESAAGISFIYKSSYTKANRLSADSFATIGKAAALEILAEVKREFDLPILTDVHGVSEIGDAAAVADCLQIPAFLCRQTELVQKAAATGLPINIKKGQFMAPDDMDKIARKATSVGNAKVMLTERGTSFGYHDLIVDFRSLVTMAGFGWPVVFDCTHAVQKPGAGGGYSGGEPSFILPLAKAAAAVGIDGLFLETHPDPQNALSDRDCQLPLDRLRDFIFEVAEIWRLANRTKRDRIR